MKSLPTPPDGEATPRPPKIEFDFTVPPETIEAFREMKQRLEEVSAKAKLPDPGELPYNQVLARMAQNAQKLESEQIREWFHQGEGVPPTNNNYDPLKDLIAAQQALQEREYPISSAPEVAKCVRQLRESIVSYHAVAPIPSDLEQQLIEHELQRSGIWSLRIDPETMRKAQELFDRDFEEKMWRTDPIGLGLRFNLDWGSWRHGWANNIEVLAERVACWIRPGVWE